MHSRLHFASLPIILTVFITVVILFMPMSTQAQETDTTPSVSGHALESVASCQNVTYGTINTVAEQDVSPEIPHFVVPPNGDGPVTVDIGLFVEGISDINPVNNTFTVEGYLDLIWCDPREGFDPQELGWPEKIFLENDARGEIQLIWWPDINFPTQVGARDSENLELIIFEDGTVEYAERFSVTIEGRFDLRQFPFDTQTLQIEIESLAWSEEFLIFHEDEALIGFSDTFDLPEWDWDTETGLSTHIESVQEIRDDVPFSEFVVDLTVHRLPGFFIVKVLLPMMLIVALSWAVFWMDESSLGERLTISFTGLLTVVAYQFIIGDSLPRLSYLTFMDAMINYSFLMMALTVVENVLVNILRADGNMMIALRIDQASRIIFPVIYAIGIAVLVGIFGISL